MQTVCCLQMIKYKIMKEEIVKSRGEEAAWAEEQAEKCSSQDRTLIS